MKSNTVLLILSFILFVSLRFAYGYMDNDGLKIFLTPTNYLIGLIHNSPSVYDTAMGYFHSKLNITIEKSCSGFNFSLIAFFMFSYVISRAKIVRSLAVIPLAAVLAYMVTIAANVSRISGYLFLLEREIPQRVDPENTWIHQAEGAFVYLMFLIIAYFTLNYILTKIEHKNEETS